MCYPPSPLFLILLQNPNLLQTLHHLTIDASAGINMVAWSRSAILCAAVGFAQTTHADGFAEIDVSGNRGGADVEPVEKAALELEQLGMDELL